MPRVGSEIRCRTSTIIVALGATTPVSIPVSFELLCHSATKGKKVTVEKASSEAAGDCNVLVMAE